MFVAEQLSLIPPADAPFCREICGLDLNGKRVQTGTTSRMIFPIATLVSYCSRFMAMLPGDIITTGTPPGVGVGMKPPQYLKPGDTITLGITVLGEQR